MRVPYLQQGPLGPELSKVYPDKKALLKPLITVVLRYQGQKQKVFALVDSGADACLFPKGVAEVLGIDVTKGNAANFTGIGGTRTPFYFHEVEILLGDYQIKTKVGFSTSQQIGTSGILGQQGFFENFIVTFDHKNRFIEIKKHGFVQDLASRLSV